MSLSNSKFWNDVYYESVIEHDHRLRPVCTRAPWINSYDIIQVDWVAAISDDIVASHPIGNYLRKLTSKSQKFKKINKTVIYQRHKPADFLATDI